MYPDSRKSEDKAHLHLTCCWSNNLRTDFKGMFLKQSCVCCSVWFAMSRRIYQDLVSISIQLSLFSSVVFIHLTDLVRERREGEYESKSKKVSRVRLFQSQEIGTPHECRGPGNWDIL